MIALLDRLRDRQQQRTGSALDRLAQQARHAAAGQPVNDADVDAALHELQKPVEFFAELVEIADRRRTAGLALEKLGTATTKQRRIDDAIASETHKYEEFRKAYLGRMAALERDKAEVDATIRKANEGRGALLDPANVIGSIHARYVEALAERDASSEVVAGLARELKKQRDRLAEEDRWIESIRRLHGDTLAPPTIFGRPESTTLARELEPHELAKSRAQRRIDELTPQLREAEERADRAARAAAAVEVEALKS